MSGEEGSVDLDRPRVHIFIDFWNFTLSLKDVDAAFKADWRGLAVSLTEHAAATLGRGVRPRYEGMNVYGSYEDGTKDTKLRAWASNVLDRFPGVNVRFVARQRKKSSPKCPICHAEVSSCPKCGADMRGTEEKGVDTKIVTDMISLAWIDAYDVAVLVSADRDFVPVAEFLHTRGLKVIHGAFPPKGAELSKKCWASIDIPKIRDEFAR